MVSSNGNIDPFGKPLGGDFGQFYILGSQFWDVSANLYSNAEQQQKMRVLFGSAADGKYWPVWYAPIISVLFAPLSLFSYRSAFLCYSIVSFAVAYLAIRMLVRDLLKEGRSNLSLYLLSFPPLLEAIAGGQLSPILLFLLALTVRNLARARRIASGIFAGLSLFKPSAFLILNAILSIRFPRFFVGAIIGGIAQLGISASILGTLSLGEWFHQLSKASAEAGGTLTAFYKVAGLSVIAGEPFSIINRTLLTGIFLSLGVFIGIFLTKWASKSSLEERDKLSLTIAIAALANCILSPYCPIYDLTLCLPTVLYLFTPDLKIRDRVLDRLLVLIWLVPHVGEGLSTWLRAPIEPFLLILLIVGICVSLRMKSKPALVG